MFQDQGNRHLIDLEETFLKACRENDRTKVRACLDLGVNVNAKNMRWLCSGLMFAVINNNIDLCEMLLGQPGIDVNQFFQDGDQNANPTALMVSCSLGREEVTQKLVSHPGIDLNFQDNDGKTAAFMAVEEGKIGCVRILSMQNNVNWNLFPRCDSPITFYAISQDNQEILKILLNISSINWNLKGIDGDTALAYALIGRKTEIAKLILTVPNLEIDLDHLKRRGVYEAAVDVCQQYFDEKLGCASNELVKLLNSRNRPECPVCYEKFSSNVHVYHCRQGHYTCGNCATRIQNCPKCRGEIIGRTYDFEDILRSTYAWMEEY